MTANKRVATTMIWQPNWRVKYEMITVMKEKADAQVRDFVLQKDGAPTHRSP
jgi:hypothetical protein